jgi:Cdc6-like AAA superfamily ATPase
MPPDNPVVTGDRTSDQPLTNPEQDLLGVASHAAVLARLVGTVPTPFTIGIYGEWGTGKTTFVHFVQHYLRNDADAQTPRTLFVHFEGWQHRTADELWRGLMLDLARAVYEEVGGKEAVAPQAPENGAAKRSWRQRLLDDAVVLREVEPEKRPQDDYRAFVQRLDATMYGGISKRSPDALRLDQDEVALAAVRASMAALGAASPLMAGLRQLLGGGGAVDVAALFHRERNEATRERIESRREFQDALQTLLDMLPKDVRVCVFLDDLDRCMPDVVLDLLEAIKIFLHVHRLVFVVAADKTLIGKGLRLRYRELLEGPAAGPEGEFFARKGEEYFEKIIQLRINLPECTPEHAHRFIAAQFPEWMPATDIIQAAVGSNPRRLKQYCSWLMFRHMVEQAEKDRQ